MTLKRISLTIILAILIRIAIIALNRELGERSNIYFFSLPALEIVSLLLALLTFAKPKLASLGIFLLAAVAINAFLRIVDYAQVYRICESEGFGGHEALCEGTFMQNLCNIPFIAVALIFFLYWKRRTVLEAQSNRELSE